MSYVIRRAQLLYFRLRTTQRLSLPLLPLPDSGQELAQRT